MRKDLVEVLKNSEEPAVFSASMARRYAGLYIFTMYFESRGEKAWVDSVIQLFGWKEGENRTPYRMAIYNIIRGLRSDFNVEIELVKARESERCGKGFSYYTVNNFGMFNPNPLFKMLHFNAEIFERIIHEDFSVSIRHKQNKKSAEKKTAEDELENEE